MRLARLARLLRLPFLMIALALGALALASPAAAAPAAHHGPSAVKVEGGSTSLTVDAGTVTVLTQNKIAVTAISPAGGKAPKFSFPIVAGKINDPKTAVGSIKHRGGLQFQVGTTKLRLKDFIIDTTNGVLTARIPTTTTRIPLLKLDASNAKISTSDGKYVVSNVRATLTAEAAAALNKTFNVTLFKAGLPIGTAKVSAEI